MTDMPNTEYITINKDGVFVGGKPATKYRGEKIQMLNQVKTYFSYLQMESPEVQEIHVGAFEAGGIYANPGNPSKVLGPNVWCRIKLFDGRLSPWIFDSAINSASDCASYCALLGCLSVQCDRMKFAGLKFTKKEEIEQPKEQYEIVSAIKLGNHRFTVEKINQNVK